ncbi:Assembly chaperone of RPL4 [Cyberlindnera fabianii]|uniref:Assembly chaperone of RPL4 n=1 Tax=Cyberlindnera fabianii TaxID=36022 RepID=A0A1V2L916_CYBFA|nr:Assembly chaperone of RPL4 [Cyberlindnera fabianii]
MLRRHIYFEQACNLDPDAGEGAEKFLYMGQIVGGRRGLELIDHGIASLTTKFEQDQDITILNQGIFAEIEIWMTDLCMDPEAEEKCNELIAQSLGLDDTNPESWSLLASIRISQQRIEEAQEGVKKSWELFEKRKLTLEENQDQDQDASNLPLNYLLYELGASIASNVRDIDEDNAESYYLEGFAHYLYIKKTQYDSQIGEFDPDKFEQFTIDSTVGFEDNAKLAKKAFDTIMIMIMIMIMFS